MAIWRELVDQLQLAAPRFKSSRKGKIWTQIIVNEAWTSTTFLLIHRIILPIDEFRGNILHNFPITWFQGHFTLRYNTPRRLKKQDFVRGYRDHGSASSESERARREANTDQTRGITQEGYVVDPDMFHRSRRKRTNEGADSS
jgi:hypothetical protein